MIFLFEGEAIEWRGPAPFVFVPVPPEVAEEIKAVSSRLTYGWGVIPASARVGKTDYTTSLFPKDGGYLLPVKVRVQRAEGIAVGDVVSVRLELAAPI